MSMIAQIDPSAARRSVDGHDGPLSANARAKQEESQRTPAQFGAAVTHRGDAPSQQRVDPGAASDRNREREAVRKRDDEQRSAYRRKPSEGRGRLVDVDV